MKRLRFLGYASLFLLSMASCKDTARQDIEEASIKEVVTVAPPQRLEALSIGIDNSSLVAGLMPEGKEGLRSIKYNLGTNGLPLIDRLSLGNENLEVKMIVAKTDGTFSRIIDVQLKWQDYKPEGSTQTAYKTFRLADEGLLSNGTSLTKASNGQYMACFVLTSNNATKPFEYSSGLVAIDKDTQKVSVENSKGTEQEAKKITIPYATKWYPIHVGDNGKDNLPTLKLVEDARASNPKGIEHINLQPLGILLRLQMDNQKERQWYYHRGYQIISDYYSERAELEVERPVLPTTEAGAKVYHYPNFKPISSAKLEHNELWLDSPEELASKETWTGMVTFSGNPNRGSYVANENWNKGTKNNLSKYHFMWLAPVSRKANTTTIPDDEKYQKIKVLAFGGRFGRWNRPYTVTFKHNGVAQTPKNGDSFYGHLVLKQSDAKKIYRRPLAIDYVEEFNRTTSSKEMTNDNVNYMTAAYDDPLDAYVPFYEDWVSVFPESIPGFIYNLSSNNNSFPYSLGKQFFLSGTTPEISWTGDGGQAQIYYFTLPQIRWFYTKNRRFVYNSIMKIKSQIYPNLYFGGLAMNPVRNWHPRIVGHDGERFVSSGGLQHLPNADILEKMSGEFAHLYNCEKVALYTTKQGKRVKSITTESKAYYTYDFNHWELEATQPEDANNDDLNTVFYGIRFLDVKTEAQPELSNDYRSIWRYEVDPNNGKIAAQAILFGDEPDRKNTSNNYFVEYQKYFNASGSYANEMSITTQEAGFIPNEWNMLWNGVVKKEGETYRSLFSDAKKYGELSERIFPTKIGSGVTTDIKKFKYSGYLTNKRTGSYGTGSKDLNNHYTLMLGSYYGEAIQGKASFEPEDLGDPQNIGTIFFVEHRNSPLLNINKEKSKAAVRCFGNKPFMTLDK